MPHGNRAVDPAADDLSLLLLVEIDIALPMDLILQLLKFRLRKVLCRTHILQKIV